MGCNIDRGGQRVEDYRAISDGSGICWGHLSSPLVLERIEGSALKDTTDNRRGIRHQAKKADYVQNHSYVRACRKEVPQSPDQHSNLDAS